jgi:ubiquinone/menaquinone biosynthesis C-methylase UbiE
LRKVRMAHVCPWWLGFFLLNPLRKIKQDPEKILRPYIRQGMTLLDVGSGMGYFSIPMAGLTGPSGRVVCLDVQEKMLRFLRRRVEKAGFSDIISARLCPPGSLGIDDLAGRVDFALLFAVAHEVPDRGRLFEELWASLKPGGSLLFAEPKGHETQAGFDRSTGIAKNCGFTVIETLSIWRSYAVLLAKR